MLHSHCSGHISVFYRVAISNQVHVLCKSQSKYSPEFFFSSSSQNWWSWFNLSILFLILISKTADFNLDLYWCSKITRLSLKPKKVVSPTSPNIHQLILILTYQAPSNTNILTTFTIKRCVLMISNSSFQTSITMPKNLFFLYIGVNHFMMKWYQCKNYLSFIFIFLQRSVVLY